MKRRPGFSLSIAWEENKIRSKSLKGNAGKFLKNRFHSLINEIERYCRCSVDQDLRKPRRCGSGDHSSVSSKLTGHSAAWFRGESSGDNTTEVQKLITTLIIIQLNNTATGSNICHVAATSSKQFAVLICMLLALLSAPLSSLRSIEGSNNNRVVGGRCYF